MDMKTIYTFVILIIVVLGGIFALRYYSETPADTPQATEQAIFAQCIEDSGAIFYGASWCKFCLEQKRMFGRAEKELPYVECSNPDRSRAQVCINEEIESYPTWIFSDGSRLTGIQDLSTLAEKTGCDLPGQSESAPEPGNETEPTEPPPPPETPPADDVVEIDDPESPDSFDSDDLLGPSPVTN